MAEEEVLVACPPPPLPPPSAPAAVMFVCRLARCQPGGFDDGGVGICWGFHALLGAAPHKSQSVQNTVVTLYAHVVARISFFFLSQAVADFLALHGQKHTYRLPIEGPYTPGANLPGDQFT